MINKVDKSRIALKYASLEVKPEPRFLAQSFSLLFTEVKYKYQLEEKGFGDVEDLEVESLMMSKRSRSRSRSFSIFSLLQIIQ